MMIFTKKDIMKTAWMLYKKEFSKLFSDCLKVSWELYKRANACNNIVNIEKATEIVNDNQANRNKFRDAELAVSNNKTRKLDYIGQGLITLSNIKTWAVKGRARIYSDKELDGVVYITNTYIEVKL